MLVWLHVFLVRLQGKIRDERFLAPLVSMYNLPPRGSNSFCNIATGGTQATTWAQIFAGVVLLLGKTTWLVPSRGDTSRVVFPNKRTTPAELCRAVFIRRRTEMWKLEQAHARAMRQCVDRTKRIPKILGNETARGKEGRPKREGGNWGAQRQWRCGCCRCSLEC